jgi:hypothetical protein
MIAHSVDADSKGAGRTFSHRANDFVEPGAARCHEGGVAQMEYTFQTVSAEAGVCAETAIVEHRGLLAFIQVRMVEDSVGIFATRETSVEVAIVAKRLGLGSSAAAQVREDLDGDCHTQMIDKLCLAFQTIRAVPCGSDGGSNPQRASTVVAGGMLLIHGKPLANYRT